MLKNKFLIFTKLLIIAIMLQVSVSCSNGNKNHVDPVKHPDLVDQSWLSDQLCSAPCWRGLELEVTSREEAIETVQKLTFVQKDNYTINADWVNFFCKDPSNITCVSMAFKDDLLTNLGLYVNYRLTLEEIIEEIGNPDSFISNYRNPESIDCDIKLFWISRQMTIDIYYTGHEYICESLFAESPKFPHEMLVLSVEYMTPNAIGDLIVEFQEYDNCYRPWNGFID